MSEPSPKHWALRSSSKPFARWSADTDQAFLLALRMTGRVRDAAAAIGRSVSCAYKRRRRDPEFAARWDAAVAEQQAAWIAEQGKAAKAVAEEPLGDHRMHRDGWTDGRRKLFLRVLSETGSVRDACARARISSTSAYQLRGKCARFKADWDAAIDTQAVTLEQAAFERAVHGWEEPIVQGGQVVAHRQRYSDSLMRTLLRGGMVGGAMGGAMGTRNGKPLDAKALVARAQEAAYAAGGLFHLRATREETNAALLKAIAAAKKRLARKAEQEGGGD
jgi:hypothetical protein